MFNYDFREKYEQLFNENTEFVQEKIVNALQEGDDINNVIGKLLGVSMHINAELISTILNDYHNQLSSYLEKNFQPKI